MNTEQKIMDIVTKLAEVMDGEDPQHCISALCMCLSASIATKNIDPKIVTDFLEETHKRNLKGLN